jgi:hypothetical protein
VGQDGILSLLRHVSEMGQDTILSHTRSRTSCQAFSRARSLFAVILIVYGCFCGIVQAQGDAESWLLRHATEAVKYEQTFKNLTAEETKFMEVFDDKGNLRQKRTVVADLLVYQSMQDETRIAEFRNVRSVDGKPVDGFEERMVDLFDYLSKVKTVRSEMNKVHDEWLKYDIGRRFWGYTITQARLFKALGPSVRAIPFGRQTIGDRETVVIVFEQLAGSRATWGADPEDVLNDISGLRNRVGVKTRYRGKLWLDRETGQLWRQETELVADYYTLAQPQVMIRWEQDYQASEFGILTPKQFVFSWFANMVGRNTAAARLELTSRTTYTYGKFTRFDVSSDEGRKELLNKGKPQ